MGVQTRETENAVACALCSDRLAQHAGCPCGRCQRIVCRACSRLRGRYHESVLCRDCTGDPKPLGFHATGLYRTWKRMIAGP